MFLFLSLACFMLNVPNEARPALEVISPTAGQVFAPEDQVDFQVQVEDGVDPLFWVAVTVSSDLDGQICQVVPGTQGLAQCSAALSEGVHSLSIVASDVDERQREASLQISVVAPETVDTGDTGSDTGDSGSDTGSDTGDSGSDTGVDTGSDTGSDTGTDTGE